MIGRWRWAVAGRYTEDPAILRDSDPGRRGAHPGGMAFTTVHETEPSADLEVSAAAGRPEIGEVVKSQIAPGARTSGRGRLALRPRRKL